MKKLLSCCVVALSLLLSSVAYAETEQEFIDLYAPLIQDFDDDLDALETQLRAASDNMQTVVNAELQDQLDDVIDEVNVVDAQVRAKSLQRKTFIRWLEDRSQTKFGKKLKDLIPFTGCISIAVGIGAEASDVEAGVTTPVEAFRNVVLGELPYHYQLVVTVAEGETIEEHVQQWADAITEGGVLQAWFEEFKASLDPANGAVLGYTKEEVQQNKIAMNTFFQTIVANDDFGYHPDAAQLAQKIEYEIPKLEHALQFWDWIKGGDTDKDGDVDAVDFLKVQTNMNAGMNSGATWEDGDFDFDGDVDFTDFLAMSANYEG